MMAGFGVESLAWDFNHVHLMAQQFILIFSESTILDYYDEARTNGQEPLE